LTAASRGSSWNNLFRSLEWDAVFSDSSTRTFFLKSFSAPSESSGVTSIPREFRRNVEPQVPETSLFLFLILLDKTVTGSVIAGAMSAPSESKASAGAI
jgi:hypothetical protein